jgi:uridylate kinase
MKIVLRIGGSVLVPSEIDIPFLKMVVREIEKVRAQHDLFIVVGGGKTARKYIQAAREFELSDAILDELGIFSSRLNALLLATCLPQGELVQNFHEVLHAKGLPVLGGTTPGQTTDTVAALLAELVQADMLIKVSNVDGIYTADPHLDPMAQKMSRMDFKDLKTLLNQDFKAGISSIIDPVAAEIITKNRLKVIVIGKEDMADVQTVISGDHSGTIIG